MTMKTVRHCDKSRAPAILVLILLLIMYLSPTGCIPPGTYDTGENDEDAPIFDDIEEAEQIALYLDDDVILNRFLLKRVFYDITLIRGAFGMEIETVEYIRFKPPCKDGRIMIVFDEEIFATVLAGEYMDWNELNDRYLPYDVKTVNRLKKVYLYFDGLLDYRALAARYGELPNVTSATCVGSVVDSPNIYPRRTDTGIDYLFRDAWGTCSTGCSNNEFYYFVCENDDAVYIGHWNPKERTRPPEWWPMAKKCLSKELREQF
jgi:hypothetical protein